MIQTQYSCNLNSNSQKVSFCSVHPARFFVKRENGEYFQITSKESSDKFRKYLSKLLSYDYNIQYSSNKYKKESAEQKSIRERLVRFFKNRDIDYKNKNIASSFLRINSQNEAEVYILTGNTATIMKNAANEIVNVQHRANERTEAIMSNFQINYNKARSMIKEEINTQVSYAKSTYFHKVWDEIRKILNLNDIKNSRFDAYFEPYKSGSKIKYRLVDAKFNGR